MQVCNEQNRQNTIKITSNQWMVKQSLKFSLFNLFLNVAAVVAFTVCTLSAFQQDITRLVRNAWRTDVLGRGLLAPYTICLLCDRVLTVCCNVRKSFISMSALPFMIFHISSKSQCSRRFSSVSNCSCCNRSVYLKYFANMRKLSLNCQVSMFFKNRMGKIQYLTICSHEEFTNILKYSFQ